MAQDDLVSEDKETIRANANLSKPTFELAMGGLWIEGHISPKKLTNDVGDIWCGWILHIDAKAVQP
jgi:hypothetical protein